MLKRSNLTHTLCFLVSGKAGVGKSYVSLKLKALCESYGLKSVITPIAYGVKSTATFMGWDGNKDTKGRKLLQDIGKAGRSYDADTWVKSTFSRIEDLIGYPYDVVIIDDWRFPNESDYIDINELLYKTVKIRVVDPDRESLIGTNEYTDISETSLDHYSFDWVISPTITSLGDYDKDIESVLDNSIKLVSIN